MTDINSRHDPKQRNPLLDASSSAARRPPDLAADGAPLPEFVELLFFAYRDFTAEADVVLGNYGFGRAHHRVLHFVNRFPGLRVADLLDILKITKQSLARVLKQLVERGFIQVQAGHADRRERLLFVTKKGRELAVLLADLQNARLKRALAATGPGGEKTVRAFLLGMVGDSERAAIEEFVAGAGAVHSEEDKQS